MQTDATPVDIDAMERATRSPIVTEQDLRAAAARLTGRVLDTPLLPCEELSLAFGCQVLLKAENLQHTGSFKVRGVTNALLARRERGERPPQAVTFSAGNHGAALAYASGRLGIPATVFVPPNAVAPKVDAIRRYGATVIQGEDFVAAAQQFAEDNGALLLHPFDDLDVIGGQGTVGLDVLRALPWVDVLIAPVGGGGLLSGIGAACAALSPSTRVVGVEPVAARTLAHAVASGGPTSLPAAPSSMADGLNAPFAGTYTYHHALRHTHQLVQVAEEEIRLAWIDLQRATRLLLEPSAAVGLAALRTGEVAVPTGGVVVLVLSGGNTDLASLAAASRTA
ncbi:threonine/serine dehydratase [Streptomyces sp. NPDC058459]|uniref:threonine ammonia-lyase n=1 Tax=Streptomyces sp. NPDC058459 TaxID=3346508 RepID=UPI00365AAE94